MISLSADLSGIGNYVGTVKGILEAVEDPRFEGDFTEHLMNEITENFMIETIAVNATGEQRLAHVFEWGARAGESSDIPLFRLVHGQDAGGHTLGYVFLPSVRQVPLPDPERYGISPTVLSSLRRHVFQLKALVMETRSRVRIDPVGAKKLFIPSEEAKKGYVMTTGPVFINPGGEESTGGFASWWLQWFEFRGDSITKEVTERTENFLVATGRKYVRYAAGTVIGGKKVGGQFASGRNISVGYVNSKAQKVKKQVLAESERYFDEDKYWETWED